MKGRPEWARAIIAGVGVVALAAAGIALFVATRSHPPAVRTAKHSAASVVSKKNDPNAYRPGKNAETVLTAEARVVDSSPATEYAQQRAYPADFVSSDATYAAQSAWAALAAGPHSAGAWQLIGPSKATYPGVLNALGDGAQYVAAGRVTAMAIGLTCTTQSCRVYVAAAGGGIWRTTKGLSGSPGWQFVSGSFGTNAIGSLMLDPTDPTGMTLYAGTGEPNASADSEAGVGIYKTTDGGDNWSFVAGSDIFYQRAIGQMALDNDGNLLVPIASGVRGIGSVDGASSSGSTTHPLVSRGLYRQTGNTFTQIFTAPAPTRGSTTVRVDPTHPGIIYVNAFQQGIWRSTNNGGSFAQIFAPSADPVAAASTTDRSEFDVTTLPSGATRMFVGEGASGDVPDGGMVSTFWRSDNADTTAAFASFGGDQVGDYCTGQCWYDNLVFTPLGHPDIVYVGGSFSYGQLGGVSNGRGVLLSTDGGSTWSDLTQDGDPHHAEFTHPDQHAIVVNPNHPLQYWEGSDGGVVRSDGLFADVSYKCDSRGLSPADNALCKSLLNRVPNQLSSLNEGFSTLQFQSLSVSSQRPQNNVQGGTQDNGTFQYTGSSAVWPQIMYGDGGQSGFGAADDSLRFNTFTGQANDVNFRNGDPTKWCVATGPIVNSPESSYFYPPVIADPKAANGGTIFQGSFSVWRTQDWGGSRAYLEANCPEFTTSFANPACGDFVPIGPPDATDLTDTLNFPDPGVYGNDRRGGAVSVIERSPNPADGGTMWVGTGTGRLFISTNANAPAASVVWTRIDQTAANDPNRFLGGIAVDPGNPNHAWVSYSGYNINTPATPGHVFEVTYAGGVATWTDLSFNLEDLPVTDLVRDDLTGDLYASSDFGVMRLANGSTTWTVAGSGMPNVEVPGLTIIPGARILYAATHGRSAWKLSLP